MILAIVGPTASGKTATSLDVAKQLGGPDRVEIISADAMQLYRGMDIGTAKLPQEERRGILHRQLDVIDIHEEASVAAYQKHARSDLEGIQASGKIPLIVGGSGLYVSALLDELEFPGRNPEIRAELEEAWETSRALLLEELREKDQRAYETIDLANPRRVIRALEVIRITGRPYTPIFPRHTSHYPDVHIVGVTRERELLNESIEQRARHMFRDGLVEETRALMERGLEEAPTASRATGYSEAMQIVHGTMKEEEAIASIAQATRRLAKKQRTWFGADPRIRWFDLSHGNTTQTAQAILSTVEA